MVSDFEAAEFGDMVSYIYTLLSHDITSGSDIYRGSYVSAHVLLNLLRVGEKR